MSNLSIDFDLNEYEFKDFSVIPKGEYVVKVNDISVRPTKSGEGRIVKATLIIETGRHKGRFIYDDINIQNPSEEAQKIGRERIKSMAHFGGVLDRLTANRDLSHLKGIIIGAKIDDKVKDRTTGEIKDKNRIMYYKNIKDVDNSEKKEVIADKFKDDDLPW